jgi:atypical dual specificity phosphatase
MLIPNVFDWLLPDRLAACVNPGVSVSAAEALRREQIRLVINLHERPDAEDLLAELGADTLHLPVSDSNPPTQDQLDEGVASIRDALAREVRVAVHCAAGLGRSGTLLAAYLVSTGDSADDAIKRVRDSRPGSVETLEQEQAVHAFERRHASGTRV